jgi:hypothetical protein
VLHGLPSDEKTDFEERESTKGRVAYVSEEGRGARENYSPKVIPHAEVVQDAAAPHPAGMDDRRK